MTKSEAQRRRLSANYIGSEVPNEIAHPLIIERLKAKTVVNERGCWVWTAFRNKAARDTDMPRIRGRTSTLIEPCIALPAATESFQKVGISVIHVTTRPVSILSICSRPLERSMSRICVLSAAVTIRRRLIARKGMPTPPRTPTLIRAVSDSVRSATAFGVAGPGRMVVL